MVMVVYAVMIVMEAVDEGVADIPVDVALADEPEGYMVTVDFFVVEAVDEEVADIPADVGEPEGYPVQTCGILWIIWPKKTRQLSARPQSRESPSKQTRQTC